MLGIDDLINYSTKRDKDIYEHGCEALGNKALNNGFNMTPNKTVVFDEAFQRKANSMSWSKGTKQITTFTNHEGNFIGIIKNYGQIDIAINKIHVSGSARWERLMPKLKPSKTTR